MSVAFVAGATGYTGRATVARLVELGVKTYAHVRPDSSQLVEWAERFAAAGAAVDATPWKLEAMKATLARIAPTHVFALLGTTRRRARRAAARGEAASDYEAVDYGLSALLLDAAIGCGAKPRFIYLSSIGVGPSSASAYIAVRWRLEQKLAASGLSYAIARPSFITGPDREEDRALERFGAKIADTALGIAGMLGARKLRDRYRSTDAKGLARGLVHLALDVPESRVFESEELRA